jgi:hypothetical protein
MEPVASAAAGQLEGGVQSVNFPVWRAILVHRAVLAVAIAAGLFVEFNLTQFLDAYARWPQTKIPDLSSRFSTWDAAHYLILSRDGYIAGSHSCAFYPLWPIAIRAASHLTFGSVLLAGLLLANGLSLAALWFFYRVVARAYGQSIGGKSLILLLAFPGALFFAFPYTESLYLLLVMAFFWELESERYFWPCVLGFLMPLTKAIGVFIVIPWAWHLWQKRKPLAYWLLLATPVVGYVSYFALMWANTGNAFEGFDAQKAYPYSPSIKNMFNVAGFSDAFVHFASLDGMMDSALDRGFFVLLLVLLPFVYRLNKTWFFYALPVGIVPALTSYFMSYRRYIMICFPVFVVLALFFDKTNRRWAFWYYVILLAALQFWVATRFVNFYWAG